MHAGVVRETRGGEEREEGEGEACWCWYGEGEGGRWKRGGRVREGARVFLSDREEEKKRGREEERLRGGMGRKVAGVCVGGRVREGGRERAKERESKWVCLCAHMHQLLRAYIGQDLGFRG